MVAAVTDRVRSAVSRLSPGYFALVMASGVVSVGLRLEHRPALSFLLLVVTAVSFVLLLLLNGWRLLSYRERVASDFADPSESFGFFTAVAAANVLGTRVAMGGHDRWAVGLFVVAGLGWLVLGYAVPCATMLDRENRPTLSGANGTWFMWVVSSQSVAVLAATLGPALRPAHHALGVLSVLAWTVGVFLYVAQGVFVALREMLYGFDFTPSYWVAMGAAAITTLAGARIVESGASPVVDAVRGVVGAVSVMFWVFATWMVPVLVAALWWRHRVQRVPVAYEPTLWSIVFPLGMYAVAGIYLERADAVPWVGAIGRAELWVALAAWALTFLAMVVHVCRRTVVPANDVA